MHSFVFLPSVLRVHYLHTLPKLVLLFSVGSMIIESAVFAGLLLLLLCTQLLFSGGGSGWEVGCGGKVGGEE